MVVVVKREGMAVEPMSVRVMVKGDEVPAKLVRDFMTSPHSHGHTQVFGRKKCTIRVPCQDLELFGTHSVITARDCMLMVH